MKKDSEYIPQFDYDDNDTDDFIPEYCHLTKPSLSANEIDNPSQFNTITDVHPPDPKATIEQTAKKPNSIKNFFKKNGKYFIYSFIILLLIAAIVTPWAKSAHERKLEKAQATSAPETVWVYVTRTGECYHRENCSYLKSKIKISLEEAEKEYRRCSRCRPPKTDKD